MYNDKPNIFVVVFYKYFNITTLYDNLRGFEYTRCGNPIRKVLQECVASLEDAKHCLTYASGLATTTASIQPLKTSDHVMCGDDYMYSGTNRYFRNIASKFGLKFTIIDMTNQKSNTIYWLWPVTNIIWGNDFSLNFNIYLLFILSIYSYNVNQMMFTHTSFKFIWLRWSVLN